MLKIRLQRIGRKNDPSFRAVLTDSKNSTKSGKFLEIVGTYNPKAVRLFFETGARDFRAAHRHQQDRPQDRDQHPFGRLARRFDIVCQ